jgi:hypothetical protein
MSKKLTNREWYLAAQYWGTNGDGHHYHQAVAAEDIARAEVPDLDAQFDYGNRICFYVQYCLARAFGDES